MIGLESKMKIKRINKNKKMISKKAQLRIQEMSFMIIAVVLFFALVGIFVITIVYTNITERASKVAEEETLASLTALSDTPEFSCVATKTNCVDGDKLISLLDKDIYQTFWPFSSLRVIKSSGFEKTEIELIECTIANYPDCDVFNVYDKNVRDEKVIASFVALCRKDFEFEAYDKCEIAKMIAGTKLIVAK